MDVCICDSVFCSVYVEAFAMGRSLVQRSPTSCLNEVRNLIWPT
jgi:hypothetical protein